MNIKIIAGLLVALFARSTTLAAAGDRYREETEVWRGERVAQLTKPDGWLSLIGLHFLKPGAIRSAAPRVTTSS